MGTVCDLSSMLKFPNGVNNMDILFLTVGLVVGFAAAWVIRGLKASQAHLDPQALTTLQEQLKVQQEQYQTSKQSEARLEERLQSSTEQINRLEEALQEASNQNEQTRCESPLGKAPLEKGEHNTERDPPEPQDGDC